jgi:hypothetical protein
MDGMDVVAGVTHAQAVATPLRQVKCGSRLIHRESYIVDGPLVKPSLAALRLKKSMSIVSSGAGGLRPLSGLPKRA